ncbi:hypothetical protein P175DRAFT_0446999 [Aspergillus ochraceoroseus IBT 24754]|uniref:Zn(2)-C6 fungal-type domain-containing protein n=1 Tax=Aspergillus ochraceoroseus IBT 24754 TaxID=1392256 RepID=A0A2T5LL67_9EURO|nr:uncharacterized protein P175DRAFT_0446999 [Aspergillus ochraceoroseus IBT 24754]PTU17030.1 hypothetical protein P175DRAFT_0446999 [Aspergillus ochraceoroseus IBT 24754]
MSSRTEKTKRPPRKHVTTACVPCRESKIRCDGASPRCHNCERKGKSCKYQHGDDKRKVSLRAATELFSARIDQLCQFIYDHGLDPPAMKLEDELGINRVLETLRIPHGLARRKDPPTSDKQHVPVCHRQSSTKENPVEDAPLSQNISETPYPASAAKNTIRDAISLLGFQYPQSTWDLAFPPAESLDYSLYANITGGHPLLSDTSFSPDSLQLSPDVAQQPGALTLYGQTQNDKDEESDSGEEDEAEKDVIEQISHRIGTLKIAGDGHLRFYGATSNLNLVDVSATQQRQRPDARTVRHDGQDILNHLRVGQPVDQALEDHLLELYFTWQNSSTYVVDKDMYMIARSKWRDELDDTPFYSEVLTNAMCAIGSAFEARYHATFITFPKSLAEFFADRAKALLEIELDSPCVATVQALVILSCHEGSSNRDARGWLYSGMSMRLAFDLGLHLDMTPYVEKGDLSTVEADVRRLAFWGSYCADHFWGFYLGRPFRMNAGDITVSKAASDLIAKKEGTWRPYGLSVKSAIFSRGLKNPNELISRQFAVLWEIISPLGHILYGRSDIPRHDLQRLCYRVTEDLFSWKANLASTLDIDLADDSAPKLPHLLMLHMQYHQIVLFAHRPWVSKSYIQPRSPRQGPGYHHARKMCIESSIAIARLLHIYEKHYTFRRMNNQVVAMIFSAALMLLYVTISTTPLSSKTGFEMSDRPEMIAHLNLCFRALDELGQSVENAKRTRDFLVALQRRWQARMRQSGATKRQMSSSSSSSSSSHALAPHSSSPRVPDAEQLASRKKSKVTPPGHPRHPQRASASFSAIPNPTATTTALSSLEPSLPHSEPPQHSTGIISAHQLNSCAPGGDLDWIRDSDLRLLSENLGDVSPFPPLDGRHSDGDEGGFPSLSDLESWWESPMNGNAGVSADGGDALGDSSVSI